MIDFKDITLAYGGETVLQDCSLRVAQGQRIALMGPSGCGKTTLLNIAAGLLPAEGAEVHGTVSYVFQEPALFPWLTAAENINAVLSDTPATLPRANEWLGAVGLADCADKYPHQLSGGQKQRVSIARALAYGGDILLLDEPFRGLDEDTRQQIADLICRTWQGKTLLLATHDPQEAEMLGCGIYRYANKRFVQE